VARLLALMLSCSVLAGCELIADFDRSKIPEAPDRDAGFLDAAPPPGDAASDTGAPDATETEDAGSDDDAG